MGNVNQELNLQADLPHGKHAVEIAVAVRPNYRQTIIWSLHF
ncbi:hypothetical protein NEISICOT_01237 [Neisseria sicca ATCC 29256]|uniref:Uncharacterized protein n=1 Tax=Neisseria sicca ATCC 29256 TaxID=547045 RepID=C6M3Z4_NEISI|nr:hypothetical protein NEISICOT_01237 [Neisseria sicca ATCC 29256]